MTTATTILSPSRSSPKRWLRRVSLVLGIVIGLTILTTFISVLLVASDVGLGGLISERMLGRDGVADSSLLLGRTGTNTELSVLGFAPVVSTLPAVGTNTGATMTATLVGRVTNMNGMPVSSGYFQWGLAPGALVNTTPTFSVTSAGDYTSNVVGLNPNDPIYYRFVTDADGTAYGTIARYLIPSGIGGFLIKNLLRVILAGVILVGVIRFGMGNPVRILLLSAIGVIGFAIISSFIETLF